ncbi:hypothetical protein BsWGS_28529 [Bradybaena similaris]
MPSLNLIAKTKRRVLEWLAESHSHQLEHPYPWFNFFAGILGVCLVICYFSLKKREDSFFVIVVDYIFTVIDVITRSLFRVAEAVSSYILHYYWLPFLLFVLTWCFFPEIIDDLLFLFRLSFKRYMNLIF